MSTHSKLGASASHRWMHCPASVQLINNFTSGGKSSIYSVGGHNAHEIAAKCLAQGTDAWEYIGQEIEEDGFTHVATDDDVTAIQFYLDRVRSLPNFNTANRGIEIDFHCPDIHRDFFGQSDFVLYDDERIDVWDYKHGVGIAVSAEKNTQLMMYATGVVRELVKAGKKLPERVQLTICQPRAFHPKGPVRSWETTVTSLEAWVQNEWLPAAKRTESNNPDYAAGDWCQFCPAKLECKMLQEIRERTVRLH
ncbi:MAG TPA: DUF2800 domain-containing protein, partial [Candidatus Paceibacterota bacterium]